VKRKAAETFRGCLERLEQRLRELKFGVLQDAYAFTLLRWGGFAGIDPKSLPTYHSYVTERVMTHPAVAAALARERVQLDTFKG
jgi:glutathione S-transferase